MKGIQPIFLIGAMKAGTSTVFKHLELHSEICFPPVKEPEFFTYNLGDKKYKVKNYFDLFKLNDKHNYIFDGSTGYTKYPIEMEVPKRIFEYGLRPKFIYVVRNPFDRIRSHYNFMRKDLSWNGNITSEHLINVSNYYLQLKQYEPYFRKDEFLILDFDDLINNHKTAIKAIYDFVGITDYVFKEERIINNYTKPVNRLELKIKYMFDRRLMFLSLKIRKLFIKFIDILMPKRMRYLTNKEKQFIYNELKDDMKQFYRNYGFDVSKWGFNLG